MGSLDMPPSHPAAREELCKTSGQGTVATGQPQRRYLLILQEEGYVWMLNTDLEAWATLS